MSSPWCSSQASASCAGVTPFSAAISFTRSTRSRLRWKFSPWKRGLARRKSSSARSSRRLDLAGEEAAAERAVGDEADAQLAHGRQDLVLRVARPQRVLGLQRADRVHLVRAPDRRRRRLGQAEVAHLARAPPARPSRPRSPRSARSGPRGAGSRGRCGRRRGARATRRTPRARTPGRRARRGARRSRRARCRTWWRGRPRRGGRAIARPTSFSLVNGPYMSAVSRKLTPSSSARWIVAIDSASSPSP